MAWYVGGVSSRAENQAAATRLVRERAMSTTVEIAEPLSRAPRAYDERDANAPRAAVGSAPTRPRRYDLVCVGGERFGVLAAFEAARLGARVALVADRLCGEPAPPRATWALADGVMARLAEEAAAGVATIDEALAARLAASGITLLEGETRFVARDRLEVAGETIRFRRCVIATGGVAASIDLPSLAEVGHETPETIFSRAELPRRMIIVGGGATACELAQGFRRLGVDTHLVSRRETLLHGEDRSAARVVERQLARDGVHLQLGWNAVDAGITGEARNLLLARRGERKKLLADVILLATRPAARVDHLALASAGVRHGSRGIEIDHRQRTSNLAIYAGGLCATPSASTEACVEHRARDCVENALFGAWPWRRLPLAPRCARTNPPLAQVGLTLDEARRGCVEIDSFRVDFDEAMPTSRAAGGTGFAVVHTRQGTGRIVGATIVGPFAREMLTELTLAMAHGVRLGQLAATPRADRHLTEICRRLGERYESSRPPTLLSRCRRYWLRWRQEQ